MFFAMGADGMEEEGIGGGIGTEDEIKGLDIGGDGVGLDIGGDGGTELLPDFWFP